MAGFWFLGLKSGTYENIYQKNEPSKSIFSPRNIFLKFGTFWRPDLSVQYLLGYSLKVLGHFRSKRTGGFSPRTIRRCNISLSPQYNTYVEKNIFKLRLHRVLIPKLMCKSVWQGGAVLNLKVQSEKATQFEIISYRPVWTPRGRGRGTWTKYL